MYFCLKYIDGSGYYVKSKTCFHKKLFPLKTILDLVMEIAKSGIHVDKRLKILTNADLVVFPCT